MFLFFSAIVFFSGAWYFNEAAAFGSFCLVLFPNMAIKARTGHFVAAGLQLVTRGGAGLATPATLGSVFSVGNMGEWVTSVVPTGFFC